MSGKCALIIPVENQVRELDAKLLLACVAAERGFSVILGSRAFVHYRISSLSRGIYLAKSMRGLSKRMFGIIRNLGHDIVAWDEESLVHYPEHIYHRRRLSPWTARQISILFAWGKDDAEMFRHFPELRDVPIHPVGNPRIDLLRKEVSPYFHADVEALRQRFGEFVLVNTNFGLVNPFVRTLGLIESGGANGKPIKIRGNAEGMTSEFAEGFGAHKQALFEHFQVAISVLSRALADRAIVVRPHPSEDHRVWQEIAKHHKNVYVLHEGTVAAWLMAAKVLVHNGCTTAVEAAVLGIPAVAFQPVRSDEFDFPLPNSVSHGAFSADDLVGTVRDLIRGELAPLNAASRRRLLDSHLASLEGPLATDRMIDAIESAGYRTGPTRAPRPVEHASAWLHGNARAVVKRLNALRIDHRNSAAYHAHRFPDISAAELEQRIDRFRRQLGRFQGVHAQPLSPYIFAVETSA